MLHQAASSDSAWLHGRLLAPPPLPQLAHAAALVGWAIGLRWAAAAADAFLNAATAAAAAAADGANAEATGRSVTAAEAATLRLLCALHARLAAHGPPTAEWAAAADEALPAVRGARALIFPHRP